MMLQLISPGMKTFNLILVIFTVLTMLPVGSATCVYARWDEEEDDEMYEEERRLEEELEAQKMRERQANDDRWFAIGTAIGRIGAQREMMKQMPKSQQKKQPVSSDLSSRYRQPSPTGSAGTVGYQSGNTTSTTSPRSAEYSSSQKQSCVFSLDRSRSELNISSGTHYTSGSQDWINLYDTSGNNVAAYAMIVKNLGVKSGVRRFTVAVKFQNRSKCSMYCAGTFFSNGTPVKVIDWGAGQKLEPGQTSSQFTGDLSYKDGSVLTFLPEGSFF